MSRIGLLGGSFNPAHRGHLKISLFAMQALGLDEIWWMVSPGNPLKQGAKDMAPLPVRLASAQKIARGHPIRATAIERSLGTRYTVDTLASLVRLYPKNQFIWLMGGDNLSQFHLWRKWRKIARIVPIAVIARPGYDRRVRASPAMGWLGRYVRPSNQKRQWTIWSTPALVLLRFRPDPTSATRLRQADPHWHRAYAARIPRDGVTRRLLF